MQGSVRVYPDGLDLSGYGEKAVALPSMGWEVQVESV